MVHLFGTTSYMNEMMILSRHPVFSKYTHMREYDSANSCVLVKVKEEITQADKDRLFDLGWIFDAGTNLWCKYDSY